MLLLQRIAHKYLKVPYRLHVNNKRKVKKPVATILFLHGIGSSGAEWQHVIDKLPQDVSIVAIDLLGFGNSPKPEWARYDAKEQAKAVIATLLAERVSQRLVVVGHSLGALVAVEVAKRYPLLVKSLVLCSPPFYNPDTDGKLPNADRILGMMYEKVEYNQKYFMKLARMAVKYKLVNPAFSLSAETMPSYVRTLKGAIISQSAFSDVQTLKTDITIVYGAFDPFVIDKNLKTIATNNPRVTLSRSLVGHEIIGRFVPAIAKIISKHIYS